MPTTTWFAKQPRYTGSQQATGRKPTQEDALTVEVLATADKVSAHLLLVADGVGGAQAGERASGLAASEATRQLKSQPFLAAQAGPALRDALRAAGRAILDRSYEQVDWRGMSTTCTAALVLEDGRLALAHVGDSRAYYCDHDGHLTQLTTDHTWAQEAIEAGRSPEELRHHPNANTITRFLGVDAEVRIDTRARQPGGGPSVDTALTPLTLKGGQVLLCSDGVSGALSEAQMAATLAEHPAPMAAQRLVELAGRAGASDNLTAVVLDLERRSRAPLALPGWIKWVALAAAILLAAALAWRLWTQRPAPAAASGAAVAPVVVAVSTPPLAARAPTVTLSAVSALPPTATLAVVAAPPTLSTVAPYGAQAAGLVTATPFGGPAPGEADSAASKSGEAPLVLVHPALDASIKTGQFKLDWDYRTLGSNETFQVLFYLEGRDAAPLDKETGDSFITLEVPADRRGKYYWQVLLRRQASNGRWVTVAQSDWWYFWAVSPSGEGGPTPGPSLTATPPVGQTIVVTTPLAIKPDEPLVPATAMPATAAPATEAPTVAPATQAPPIATATRTPILQWPPTKTPDPSTPTKTPRTLPTPKPTKTPK
jgi:serine/threonine protein phosphatase PrpC